MEKYISKDALVTEIKSRISDIEISQKAGLIKKRDADKKILLFKSVLSLINTLEVKEVDLEKTINDYFKDWKFDEEMDIMVKPNNYSATFDDIKEVAKYFFELGMTASNKA